MYMYTTWLSSVLYMKNTFTQLNYICEITKHSMQLNGWRSFFLVTVPCNCNTITIVKHNYYNKLWRIKAIQMWLTWVSIATVVERLVVSRWSKLSSTSRLLLPVLVGREGDCRKSQSKQSQSQSQSQLVIPSHRQSAWSQHQLQKLLSEYLQ